MAIIYNISNISAANNTVQILQAVDKDLTGGVFSIFVVMIIFIVLIMQFSKDSDPQGAILAASFLTTIISIMFFAGGFVPLIAVIYMIIITVLAMGVKIIL